MYGRYDGLRCRPGDLAVIVRDEPECQANIGRIVRVLQESYEFPDELGFHWEIVPVSSTPSPVLISSYRNKNLNRKIVFDSKPRAHLDAWLRPLVDDAETQETTTSVQAEEAGKLTAQAT